MNIIKRNVDITTTTPVVFVPLSDVHVGHVDFDRQYFKDTIAWIKKKGALSIFMGDMIDGIGMQDRRFEIDSIDPFFLPHLDDLYRKEVEVFCELVEPIKDQVVCMLGEGNHETTVKKGASFDAGKEISEKLGIPILTDPGFCGLCFNAIGSSAHKPPSVNVKMWVSHGCFLGGRLRGGKINGLERIVQYFPGCDLYLAGHTHDKWITESHQIILSKNMKVVEKRCYFANTGAFLRTYQEKNTNTWASRSVFSPQVPGCVRFDFYLKRRKSDDVRYIDIHGRV
jgi:hypothetical protein